MTNENMPKMLTIRQCAALNILPEHALRTMAKKGQLPGFSVGSRYYVNVGKLIALLQGEPR